MPATSEQPELLPAAKNPDARQVAWLVSRLEGRDWRTAAQILEEAGIPDTDDQRRRLRALAQASGGEIAGGQFGYKLVRQMTSGEYNHFRNWMSAQADEMKRRVIRADKVWYARAPVHPGHGLLTPPDSSAVPA